jgi:hypothetical protein
VVRIDDNYEGLKTYNTYVNEKIVQLKGNSVFFPSAYLFLLDDPEVGGPYERQYRAKYGDGNIYNNIPGAIEKLELGTP